MARYKDYSYEQQLLIPVSLSKQVLPGTFEYTLNTLIDTKLDLSVFAAKYKNDDTGAPAYDPAVLLKNNPLCLFQRHHQQSENRAALSGKCGVHGTFR